MKGKRRRGRQKKRWEDNTKEWTGMDFASSTRAAENRCSVRGKKGNRTEPNRTNGLYRTEPTKISDCCGTGFYLRHRTEPTNSIITAYFIIISFHFIKLITYYSRFYLFKYHLLYLRS